MCFSWVLRNLELEQPKVSDTSYVSETLFCLVITPTLMGNYEFLWNFESCQSGCTHVCILVNIVHASIANFGSKRKPKCSQNVVLFWYFANLFSIQYVNGRSIYVKILNWNSVILQNSMRLLREAGFWTEPILYFAAKSAKKNQFLSLDCIIKSSWLSIFRRFAARNISRVSQPNFEDFFICRLCTFAGSVFPCK